MAKLAQSPTWSNILSSHGASGVKGFTLPQVFQIGRVLPTNWYPPGESIGYMHMYAPPSPTVPSSVNVRAGLYLGTTSLCLQGIRVQVKSAIGKVMEGHSDRSLLACQ